MSVEFQNESHGNGHVQGLIEHIRRVEGVTQIKLPAADCTGGGQQRPDVTESAACTCRSRGECMTCRRHIRRSMQREERRAAMNTNRGLA